MSFPYDRYIRPRIIHLACLTLTSAGFVFAQTVTAPNVNETIKAADDFATQAFQDPWDMSRMTDLGWFTYGVDAPVSNLTNIAFSGGIFSATTASSVPSSGFPNFWLLDPNGAFSSQLGKVGTVYPIDPTRYQRFLIRMNLPAGLSATPNACAFVDASQCAQLIWNLYGTQSTSKVIPVYSGWWIYAVDLPTLGSAAGPAWSS